jgi:shikimate dehydrogenase
MYPDTNKKPPICYSGISHNHFLIDLIYNPNKTLFLKEAERHGASVFNGLDMLRKQAEEAWKIWISKK